MTAVNYTNLRNNMKFYFDKISDGYETMIVTRKGDGNNIVMLPEDTYNNLVENFYLLGNKNNYDWLMKGKNQIEQGLGEIHELAEDYSGE